MFLCLALISATVLTVPNVNAGYYYTELDGSSFPVAVQLDDNFTQCVVEVDFSSMTAGNMTVVVLHDNDTATGNGLWISRFTNSTNSYYSFGTTTSGNTTLTTTLYTTNYTDYTETKMRVVNNTDDTGYDLYCEIDDTDYYNTTDNTVFTHLEFYTVMSTSVTGTADFIVKSYLADSISDMGELMILIAFAFLPVMIVTAMGKNLANKKWF